MPKTWPTPKTNKLSTMKTKFPLDCFFKGFEHHVALLNHYKLQGFSILVKTRQYYKNIQACSYRYN